MSSTKGTPKLRFPGFSGEWRVSPLGKVTKWASGGTPPKEDPSYWGGGIPWISAASMYGKFFDSSNRTLTAEGVKSGSKIARQGSVLLLVRGSMLFNTIPVGIAGKDVAFNQDVKAITSDDVDRNYLYYFFKSSEHSLLSQVVGTGIGAGKLDTDQLQHMVIHIPQKAEQEKIAKFLTVVDERVATIDKKVELLKQYKKGVMQKIFTQQIRFKDEGGSTYREWQPHSLGDIGSTYNGLSGKTGEDFGDGSPYITYMQIFNGSSIDARKFARVRVGVGEKQNIAKRGDVLFTTSSETPQEVGYSSVLLEDVGDVYLNSFCFGYRIKGSALLPSFAQFLFRSVGFRKDIMRLAQGSTRYNLSKAELMKVFVDLPSLEEQQKIADFLTAVDDKIEAEEARLSAAKTFKKSLLQRMFV